MWFLHLRVTQKALHWPFRFSFSFSFLSHFGQTGKKIFANELLLLTACETQISHVNFAHWQMFLHISCWLLFQTWVVSFYAMCVVCIYFRQFIHPLSFGSCGNRTTFAFMSYIIVLAKFYNVTFLNNFYFVSFFYPLFICRRQRKIRIVILSKSYSYKLFF